MSVEKTGKVYVAARKFIDEIVHGDGSQIVHLYARLKAACENNGQTLKHKPTDYSALHLFVAHIGSMPREQVNVDDCLELLGYNHKTKVATV